MKMLIRPLFALLATVMLAGGCDQPPQQVVVSARPVPVAAPPVQQQPPSSVMSTDDFDLASASGLIQNGRVQDANSLQAAINDPAAGINNVDLDHDGNIDPVTVNEVAYGAGKQFNLVANPTSGGAPVTIATINVNVSAPTPIIHASYPSYVLGYDTAYYNYQVGRNLAFMMWALSPRPLFVPLSFSSYGWYHRTPVYARDVVVQRRTEYDTRLHVSPVRKEAPPREVLDRDRAERLPSSYAKAAPTPATNNLSDRAQAKDFQVRDTQAPVQRATGFGARQAATAAPAAAPAPAPAPRAAPAPAAAPASRPSFSRPSGGGGPTSSKRR